MGRPEVARQHIPNPDGALLLATSGLPGLSGAQNSNPQLGRGRSRGLKAAQGAGAEGALAGLLTLTGGGRGLGAVL